MAKRILTVDDSASIRGLLRFTLEQAGYAVEEAADGDAGVAAATAGGFDLVITDLNMPGKSGLEFVQALRADKRTLQVPVVLLTTQADGETKQLAKAAGASGWMTKPFQPERLLEVVAKLVG
jgi:two-component system chemotaxis response regulator CheY